ncbi:MAG: hypothetical protein SF053_16525, partial [Bacteroidia bacterium]|nr:hypothetical protein [Bacteroidia bacterium]
YQNPQNLDPSGSPLPIYPVYILAESFTTEKVPVIRVSRGYRDAATQAPLTERHAFIEALTHDATVIQAEHLRGQRRTVLERFLSIFDQSSQTDVKGHILALVEEDFPEVYRPVIRRLHRALQHPTIEEEMDLEDEVLNELHKKDELLAAALQREAEALQREEEARQQAEAAQQRTESERNTKNTLIRYLHTVGRSIPEIAEVAGIDEAEVRQVLGE